MLPLGQAECHTSAKELLLLGNPTRGSRGGGAQRKSFEPLPRWFRPLRGQLKLSKCPALTKRPVTDVRPATASCRPAPQERHVWLGGARASRPEKRLSWRPHPTQNVAPPEAWPEPKGRCQPEPDAGPVAGQLVLPGRDTLRSPATANREKPGTPGEVGWGRPWQRVRPGGDACATLLPPRVTARPPLTAPAV